MTAPDPQAEASVPWGMNIAIRYSKVHPTRRIDAAEATARAVLSLLAAPESQPGGPWHEAVTYWSDRRIRKLVRRARGARWDEVQALPGITVAQEGPRGWAPAEARAFVPAPVRPLPPALAKTQVEGTHFPHGGEVPPPPAAITEDLRRRGIEATSAQAAEFITLTEESTSAEALVVVEVTPLEVMTSGKLCAQVAHGAQIAWSSPQMPSALRDAWAATGYRVRVTFPSRESWACHERPVSIVDAGFTELDGPTETVRAYWRE